MTSEIEGMIIISANVSVLWASELSINGFYKLVE